MLYKSLFQVTLETWHFAVTHSIPEAERYNVDDTVNMAVKMMATTMAKNMHFFLKTTFSGRTHVPRSLIQQQHAIHLLFSDVQGFLRHIFPFAVYNEQ